MNLKFQPATSSQSDYIPNQGNEHLLLSSSVIVTSNRFFWPLPSMLRKKNTEFRWKASSYIIQNDSLYYLLSNIDKTTKVKTGKYPKYLKLS